MPLPEADRPGSEGLRPPAAPPPPRPRGAGLRRPGGLGRGLTSRAERAAGPALIPHRAPAARSPRRSAARTCEMGRSRPTPPPLLLVGLALLGAARADGDLSLHPPYFNLAEGARIAASATCGEEAPARGSPRPTEDLYCKLVGGPVAGGDPNQTIQVSAGRAGSPRAGCERVRTCNAWLTWRRAPRARESPGTNGSPRVPPRLSGSTFQRTEGTPTRPFRLCQKTACAHRPLPPWKAGHSVREKGAGWCPDFGGPIPGMRARWDLAAAGAACAEGGLVPPSPGLAGTCCRRPDGTGTGREWPDPGGSPC